MGWGGWIMFSDFRCLPLLLFSMAMPQAADAATTFDTWAIGFDSTDNHFTSGPSLLTTPGSNALGIAFTNTVYGPGTPIDNFINGSCGATNCIASFYYTLPMEIKVDSPSLNVIAGHNYAIQFNVNLSNFDSTADQHVEFPNITFEYVSSDPSVTLCGSCALALVSNTNGLFSLNFVPTISGSIEFGLDFSTGRNANGVSSSSASPFTETASYVYSNFSVVDLSAPPFTPAVPEPSTWAMLILGFCSVGFMAYGKRKNGLALTAA
jgi:hypothetical protein